MLLICTTAFNAMIRTTTCGFSEPLSLFVSVIVCSEDFDDSFSPNRGVTWLLRRRRSSFRSSLPAIGVCYFPHQTLD